MFSISVTLHISMVQIFTTLRMLKIPGPCQNLVPWCSTPEVLFSLSIQVSHLRTCCTDACPIDRWTLRVVLTTAGIMAALSVHVERAGARAHLPIPARFAVTFTSPWVTPATWSRIHTVMCYKRDLCVMAPDTEHHIWVIMNSYNSLHKVNTQWGCMSMWLYVSIFYLSDT